MNIPAGIRKAYAAEPNPWNTNKRFTRAEHARKVREAIASDNAMIRHCASVRRAAVARRAARLAS